MVEVALLIRLTAKAGKEQAVADFLRGGLALVELEPDTTTWYGLQFGPSTFGIFDTFPGEAGRKAHLGGKVAEALFAAAPDLLAAEPTVEMVQVLAAKGA